MTNNNNETNWNNVAHWYDNYLKGDDTYQAKVIAPNLARMLALSPTDRVLDVACGQGYFARLIAEMGTTVVGVDSSSELIELAARIAQTNESYRVGDAEKLPTMKLGTFDAVFSVLAFENIKNISKVLEGMNDCLKNAGKVVLVLLHPAFRIPQHSDWGYDMKAGIQYRKTQKYLSEVAIPIELTPHNKGGKKEVTTTFHRSLQWYVKAFRNAGFAITNLEEWISHKKSDAGPRQVAEDAARKEIPMFMAIELRKIS
ncbi:methyltransferase domain-containing protein [Patescibacteria group bacterium]|nr:methyltransferase domain-containing protein [Patescibacteria group bacterium]